MPSFPDARGLHRHLGSRRLASDHGLYDALLDHQPVLAIVGQQARNALGGQYQQELDLVSMFKDVAGAYVAQASSPAQVRHLIDRAAGSRWRGGP